MTRSIIKLNLDPLAKNKSLCAQMEKFSVLQCWEVHEHTDSGTMQHTGHTAPTSRPACVRIDEWCRMTPLPALMKKVILSVQHLHGSNKLFTVGCLSRSHAFSPASDSTAVAVTFKAVFLTTHESHP